MKSNLSLAQGGARAHADEFVGFEANIIQIQNALDQGQLSSAELVKGYLARVEAYDQQNTTLNAIVRINHHALAQAKILDEERKQNKVRSPLHGIPVILKDNYSTYDMPTSGGSVALAGFIPPQDAFLVKKLREAGAIILAKANMDEFALGFSGMSPVGGQTKNPYDLRRTPGSSSGGTAAAIAANFAVVGMGTDTCSSILSPASFNSLVGFRPSKGIASIAGIIPSNHAKDVGGPIVRTVSDVAVVMDAVVGYDPQDIATLRVKERAFPGFVSRLGDVDMKRLRLGRINNYFIDNEVGKIVDQALDTLRSAGAKIIKVEAPLFDGKTLWQMNTTADVNGISDISDYLGAYPGADISSLSDLAQVGIYREFLAPFVNRENYIFKESDYQRRLNWKTKFSDYLAAYMDGQQLDALVYPTSTVSAVLIGAAQPGSNCALSEWAGAPALSLPAGFTKEGLPVGLELLGAYLSDEKLVAIAYAVEAQLQQRRAPTTTPALVAGKAPKPLRFTTRIDHSVTVDFLWDITKSTLGYKTRLSDIENTHAVCLHLAKQGPIIQCLSGPEGRRTEGVVELNAQHISALQNNELTVRIYSIESPLGEKGAPLLLPKA